MSQINKSVEEVTASVDFESAKQFNVDAEGHGWRIVSSGYRAGSSDFVKAVALFQYGVGLPVDGRMSEKTVSALRFYKSLNYWQFTDQRVYGITLAQAISLLEVNSKGGVFVLVLALSSIFLATYLFKK